MTNAKIGKCGKCALNPAVGHEREYNAMEKDGLGRKIVVIGAGDAVKSGTIANAVHSAFDTVMKEI